MNAFAAAAATLFRDPNRSVEAVMSIKDHRARTVRVIRHPADVEGDIAGSSTQSLGSTFEVLQSACLQKPPVGTAIAIGREVWIVFDVSSNVSKGTWILSAALP